MSKRCVLRCCTACLIVTSPAVHAQVMERLSVDSEGTEAALGATVSYPNRSVDASGRFVVFASESDDLVADDGNEASDVFLRDRVLGTTVRVSVNKDDGGDASGASANPCISDNGRYVAFGSVAGDLVDGDGNGLEDVFVWDRVAGSMIRASVAADGGDPDGGSNHPALSADGNRVAFRSYATNLVAAGANINGDIYVRDLALGATVKVTVRHDGSLTELNSWLPSLSADGLHVSFTSGDSGLVADDTNSSQDVFVGDLESGTIERVSITTAGGEATGRNAEPAISGDGMTVSWRSRATDLVEGDTNGVDDILVRDRVAGTTTRVSVSSIGEQAEGSGSWQPSISDDGRFVAFCSDAHNLVDDDTGLAGGVFSHDRLTGVTRRHSVTMSGEEAWDYSRRPSLTPDGAFMVFESGASNFVPDDTNAAQDVFIAWGPAMVWCDGFESGELAGWSSATN
jgi:Tol biopolymer transport system component